MEDKKHNIVVIEKEVQALTPLRFTGLKIDKRDYKAVGVPAIRASLQHGLKWMKTTDMVRTMFAINQKGGFDCPGCAWPDPDDDRSAIGEYCENGIKAIAEEAQNKIIGGDFFQQHSVAELSRWSDYELGKSGRIGEPLVLQDGFYEPISWEAAYTIIADELNALASPDEAIFYTSGKVTNEPAFLFQLFVRQFGTNNLPDCSNMCHESSGKALSDTLGIGKGSVTLEDLYISDLIIIMGQNPGTNHPRMMTALEKCKQNGGTIIAVNPLPEAGLMHYINPQNPWKIISGGTHLADLFLQVKINGDVALLKAIMYLLVVPIAPPAPEGDAASSTPLGAGGSKSQNAIDWAFIKEKTLGFEELVADFKKYSFKDLVEESGVREDLIVEAARLISEKKNMIICWAMGLTQHKNSVGNVQEIVNLLLLRGSIGKPGAGTCPIRGHSNVQGDRTMGVWEELPEWLYDNLKKVFHFDPPKERGFNTVESIQAMHAGKAKVFFGFGGNFLSATPDTNFTAEALQKCSLTVHISTKLNRSHLVHGEKALILPCLGRTEIDKQASGEQFVSCENSMGIVGSSRGILEPCSKHLKSETAIICELAYRVLGNKTTVNWLELRNNYDKIRDLIAQVIGGFENFNEKIRQPAGFYLPNSARDQRFNTHSGKAHFTINPTSAIRTQPDEYVMMTIRSHDQFNTTIYGLDDRYRGIHNERRVIFMNMEDVKAAGLKERDVVDLFSHYKGVERNARQFIVVPYDIPRGNVATYFPETNSLVPVDEYADKSYTPISKSVVIRLKKASNTEGGE